MPYECLRYAKVLTCPYFVFPHGRSYIMVVTMVFYWIPYLVAMMCEDLVFSVKVLQMNGVFINECLRIGRLPRTNGKKKKNEAHMYTTTAPFFKCPIRGVGVYM